MRKRIFFFVFVIHSALFLWMKMDQTDNQKKKKKLLVKTVQIAPAQKITTAVSSISSPAEKRQAHEKIVDSPQIKPKTQPPSQKPKKTIPTPPKKQDKKQPVRSVGQKNSQPKNAKAQKLIKQLEESVAKIETKRDKRRTGNEIAEFRFPFKLQIDNIEIGKSEIAFETLLTQKLKNHLVLPEQGAVKCKITVDQNGKVIYFATIKTESEKNEKYLEKEMKNFIFPPFQGDLSDKKTFTFILTFLNDK
ncbi:MAG: hypothetical protein L0207_02190 [Chlamydiae bacterium]|nr:hypothetical protein [Chlamydiota bacterium]